MYPLFTLFEFIFFLSQTDAEFVKPFFASIEINIIFILQFNVLSHTDQFADVCVLSRSIVPDSLQPHGL